MNKIARILPVGLLFALAILGASCHKRAGQGQANPCIQHGKQRTLYVSIYATPSGQCDVDYAVVNLSMSMQDKVQWYSNETNATYEVRFEDGSPFQQAKFSVDGNGSTPNPKLQNPSKTYYTYSVYTASGKCRDASDKKDGVDPGVHITQ
jgi:hypothetical protein